MITLLTTIALLSTVVTVEPATASGPYAPNDDYCLGQCDDILPAGNNGSATVAQILGYQTLGTGYAAGQRHGWRGTSYGWSLFDFAIYAQ